MVLLIWTLFQWSGVLLSSVSWNFYSVWSRIYQHMSKCYVINQSVLLSACSVSSVLQPKTEHNSYEVAFLQKLKGLNLLPISQTSTIVLGLLGM